MATQEILAEDLRIQQGYHMNTIQEVILYIGDVLKDNFIFSFIGKIVYK
jgi:hypothetical protein